MARSLVAGLASARERIGATLSAQAASSLTAMAFLCRSSSTIGGSKAISTSGNRRSSKCTGTIGTLLAPRTHLKGVHQLRPVPSSSVPVGHQKWGCVQASVDHTAFMSAGRVIDHDRGRVTITSLGPCTSHFVVEGTLDDVLADAMTAEGSRISRNGDGIALHDWSKLVRYTSSARVRLTDWMMQHRHGFEAVHILVSSNLVAMGVNVANLALGGFLHAGTDPAAFAALVESHRRR